MHPDLLALLGYLPWAALVVFAAAHASLRYRHRLAKETLSRVRRERDEANAKIWQRAIGSRS